MCLYVLVCVCCPSAGYVEAGRFLGLGDQTALWYKSWRDPVSNIKATGVLWNDTQDWPLTWMPHLCKHTPHTDASVHTNIPTRQYTQTQNQANIKIRQGDGSGDKGLTMKISKLALRPPDSRVYDSCTQEVELEDAWRCSLIRGARTD